MRIYFAIFFIFIPFFSFTWCLNIDILVQTGSCLSHQQSLLLHLRNNLLFNLTKSTKLRQWNQTTDCCQWNGVICDAGLVTALDLSEESIYGGIDDSSSLFSLQYLQTLNLSYNTLNATIPSAFHKLISLRYLYLINTGFVGQIPIEISQLTSLVSLDMSTEADGDLKLENPNLQTLIQNLSNLSILYLDGVTISANGKEWCNALSSSLPKLRTLGLGSCNLSGPLDSSLARLKSLVTIDLSDNSLEGLIPSSIFMLPSLMYINLSHNQFEGQLDNLENVSSSLRLIDLSNNHLEGYIPSFILNLPSLVVIELHHNQFQGQLDSFINVSSSLQLLDLSNNNLYGIIPQDIGNYLPELHFLSLSGNKFKGTIPKSLCNLIALEVLDLSKNSFTGRIPECLIAMNGSINILNLSSNKLSGLIDTLPGSCNLDILHLNDNLIEGTLPKYLATCTGLQVLDLGNNRFNDKFPCWLNNISTLQVLILRSNKLHGSISCARTNVSLSSLHIFDLASNNFSGSVLPEIFESKKSMMSDANHLQLEELTYGDHYKETVTVTCKGLKMELAKTINVFTSIDLSCNKFEGSIPEEIGQLKALGMLNLSHNDFSSHIPSSLGNLKNLESLDLSHNSLSGEIPTQLASMNFLGVLNLSFNHLVGTIPTGTQFQTFPPTSFVGNEHLCGPPLTQNCSKRGGQVKSYFDAQSSIDWNFISIELGYTFGIGIVFLPLLLWKPWRLWYWEHVENILYRIFPRLNFVYKTREGQTYRTLRWRRY